MKNLVFILCLSFNLLAATKKGTTIFVDLSPAGSFEAKSSKIKGGKVVKDNGKYTVENIYIPSDSIETGIDLRDEHLRKRLGKEDVTVIKAEGKDGKGKGQIKINGIVKDFDFTFEEIEKKYLKGKFKLKLSDFKITDISYMGIGVEDSIIVEAIVKFSEKKSDKKESKIENEVEK